MKSALAAALLALAACSSHPQAKRYPFEGGHLEATVEAVQGALRRVAVRSVFSAPVADPAGAYDSVVALQEHDCAAARYRVLDAKVFLRGEPVPAARTSSGWVPASGALHRDACR